MKFSIYSSRLGQIIYAAQYFVPDNITLGELADFFKDRGSVLMKHQDRFFRFNFKEYLNAKNN